MKKIIPIIATIGIGTILTGCNTIAKTETESLNDYISNFQQQIDEYSNTNKIENMNTRFKKYNLSLNLSDEALDNDSINNSFSNNDANLTENDGISDVINENLNNFNKTDNLSNNNNNPLTLNEINANNQPLTDDIDLETTDNTDKDTTDKIDNINNETGDIKTYDENSSNINNQISTLYSLSSDINESCDDFCELKKEITDAIIETQNLINKVKNNEVELTTEQKMFITEQAKQLKSLSRQLGNITTELSINLSDLSYIMRTNNENFDELSMKYLIVLDNLVNGNEMLENGLTSLYMINSIFNTTNTPANNQGRILYGFRRNNEPPIVKDYLIENGKIIENKTESADETDNSEEKNNDEKNNDEKGNLDTYLNTNVNSNIDTYGNKYNNIDTFFNTALFDNELYSNRYGYGGMGMYGYPYNNYGYQNYNGNINNTQSYNPNTRYDANNAPYFKNERKAEPIKKSKKFKITSNIDTYRDKDTPTLSARFNKIKSSISSFLNKFKRKNENVESEINKLTDNSNDYQKNHLTNEDLKQNDNLN